MKGHDLGWHAYHADPKRQTELRRAEALAREGRYLEAAKLFAALLPEGDGPIPKTALAVARRAVGLFLRGGDGKAATTILERSRVGRHLLQRARVGESLLRAERADEASREFSEGGDARRAIEALLGTETTDPSYRTSCVSAIHLANDVGEVTYAVDRFLAPFVESAPHDPTELEALSLLAMLYAAKDMEDDAQRVASALLFADPTHPIASQIGVLTGSRASLVDALPLLPDLSIDDLPELGDIPLPPVQTPVEATLAVAPTVPMAHAAGATPTGGAVQTTAIAAAVATTQGPPGVMKCLACGAPMAAGADVCPACGRTLGTLVVGSVLGNRYEMRAVLGQGGMGLVYRAFDRLLDEEVAIKTLRTDQSGNADVVRRFRSEIKLARKVSHPNVCRIHDYGEEGPLGYISMEILTGQDLQKTLRQQRLGLPPEEALAVAVQIAAGLQAIHDVGVLHRDLKTANVSRDERGHVKLVDFGIAKDLLSQGQTATGEAFGTPEYMSPEQCRGEPLDFRSDIYALGTVVFELFTGEVPLRASTTMATLFRQVQEMPSFDDERGLRVPRGYVPVLQRALAKNRADRFASVREFAEALRDVAVPEPSAAPSGAVTVPLSGKGPTHGG